MNAAKKRIYLIFIAIAISCMTNLWSQSRTHLLRKTLINRLSQIPGAFTPPMPPVYVDYSLVANAKYENDSIFLGNIQWVFQSFDDSLSLIYHEYIHSLLQKIQKFQVALDSSGNIVQWDTDETYLYKPFSEEVNLSLKQYEEEILLKDPEYNGMSAADREWSIQTMRRDISKSNIEFFKYAPSNLALEELAAYRQQLKAEKIGLYTLSPDARISLQIRIKQLKDTYKRRRSYEKKHKLKRNGANKG